MKRTRWNNRTAGQGRYPGIGLIRKFGPVIVVLLREPPTRKEFKTEQEVIDFLKTLERN